MLKDPSRAAALCARQVKEAKSAQISLPLEARTSAGQAPGGRHLSLVHRLYTTAFTRKNAPHCECHTVEHILCVVAEVGLDTDTGRVEAGQPQHKKYCG
jgi:hypothetical protein